MRKIPTAYVRDENRRYVLPEIDPQCSWILDGEATPRRKFDGTCVMFSLLEGRWYARREVKAHGTPPAGWTPVADDPVTGKRVGWEPVEQSSFAKFHAEAVRETFCGETPWNGTYELIGPKINGNPEKLPTHMLARHETAETPDELHDPMVDICADDPQRLVRYLGREYGWEGLVWTHPDGRRAKLKAKDLPGV